MTADDSTYMQAALEEARAAEALDEVPVGCVVVDAAGQILGRGHNRTRTDASPLAHAELLALAQATTTLGYERLTGCTVYVTLEPCFMCAGALAHARIARVVFPLRDPKFGGCVSLGNVLSDPRMNHRAHVDADGPLEDECRALMVGFFRRKRAER